LRIVLDELWNAVQPIKNGHRFPIGHRPPSRTLRTSQQ
jgi:hypothetical protein